MTVDIFSHDRTGWLGIGFGNGDEHLLDLITFYPNTFLFFANHTKHSPNVSQPQNLDQNFGYLIDNLIHVTFELPVEFLEGIDTIFFARSYEGASLDSLSNHEKVGRKFVPWNNKTTFIYPGWCVPTWVKLPGRLMALHYGSLIAVELFSLVVFLFMVYLRDEQPFKSRGLSPYINVIIFSILYIVEYILASGITFEESYYVECFVSSLILYPLVLSIALILFAVYFRYILVININVQKEKIYKSQSEPSKYIKLLNILNNQYFPWTLPILYLTFYFVIWIIVYSALGFECGNGQNGYLKVFYVISVGVFILMVILLQLYDLFQNRKLLFKFDLKRFFITQDPYYFRLELSTLFLIPIPVTFWFLPLPTIITITFLDIAYFMAFYNTGILSLIITIWKKFFKRNVDDGSNCKITSIFERKDELLDLFIEFSKYEWSLENVYFRLDVEKYLKSNNRKIMYQLIHEKYLNFSDSVYEINVDAKSIHIVVNKASDQKFTDDLFDNLLRIVDLNLSDTYFRFLQSDDYQSYKIKMKMI